MIKKKKKDSSESNQTGLDISSFPKEEQKYVLSYYLNMFF